MDIYAAVTDRIIAQMEQGIRGVGVEHDPGACEERHGKCEG